MRDFHKRKKDETHRTTPAEPTISGLLDQGQRQHIHRFRSGPSGLQEFSNRRKRKKISSLEPLSTISSNSNSRQEAPIQQTREGEAAEKSPKRKWPSDHLRVLEVHTAGEVSPIASVVEQQGALDPFHTLPLPNGPRTKTLLYHGEWCSNFPLRRY